MNWSLILAIAGLVCAILVCLDAGRRAIADHKRRATPPTIVVYVTAPTGNPDELAEHVARHLASNSRGFYR